MLKSNHGNTERRYVNMKHSDVEQILGETGVYLPDYLKERAKPVWFKKGETVAVKDQEAKYAYLVLLGDVVLQAEFESGDYYSYAHLQAGRFISDLEALSQRMVFVATLIALKDTFALQFNIEDFVYCLDNDSKFLRYIIYKLCNEIYETSYRRGENIYLKTKNRIIKTLLQSYKNQYAMDEGKQNYIIPLTRNYIASEVGLSVRTVHREIKLLKHEKLIGIVKGKVSISPEQRELLADILSQK